MNRVVLSVPSRRLLAVLAALAAGGCSLRGAPIGGQVVDDATGQPIPGAIVAISWYGSVSTIAHPQSICIHVDSTSTDALGRYHFDRWSKQRPAGMGWDMVAQLEIHKAGDIDADVSEGLNLVRLQRFSGSPVERLLWLQRSASRVRICSAEKIGGKRLLPFYRALYEEGKELASTREDQRIVSGLLSEVEFLELGRDEGMRRAIERAEQRERQ